MLADNTTCQQLVFRDVNQSWKISGQHSSTLSGGIRKRLRTFSDKVIKIPSRRGPDALRYILNDFEANANGKSF
jgi:hypothetical protein